MKLSKYLASRDRLLNEVIMKIEFINPFSEEFFSKEKELSDVQKSQNLQDNNDALVHLSYKRLNP